MGAFALNLSALVFPVISFFVADPAQKILCMALWAAIFCTAQIVSAIDRNAAVKR